MPVNLFLTSYFNTKLHIFKTEFQNMAFLHEKCRNYARNQKRTDQHERNNGNHLFILLRTIKIVHSLHLFTKISYNIMNLSPANYHNIYSERLCLCFLYLLFF